jgi:hypothetical protein
MGRRQALRPSQRAVRGGICIFHGASGGEDTAFPRLMLATQKMLSGFFLKKKPPCMIFAERTKTGEML